MQKRHSDRECYFEEQARTSEKYYIPYILNHVGAIPDRILEVGCGEGGNLLPFARHNCEVVGVDLAKSRIEQAAHFFNERGQHGTFIYSDIFDLKEYYHCFPLIIVHDVIEHIAEKEQFLSGLKKFLAPGGYVYIGFPAWQMPFGGHQQIARGKIVSHWPFIHLLPPPLYRIFLKAFGEKENTVGHLLEIQKTRCSVERFLRVVRRTNYKIVSSQLYLINPHYETKFGLTPRKLSQTLSGLPYVRNFFSTSCFYILKNDE